MLDRRSRNQRRIVLRIHQQPGIDELVGIQRVVPVIEKRPRLHRTRCGVDQGVEGDQCSRSDLLLAGTVEGGNSQRSLLVQVRLNLPQAIFGNREDHRRRLQLRNHHQRSGCVRYDKIAGVHQPQAHAA